MELVAPQIAQMGMREMGLERMEVDMGQGLKMYVGDGFAYHADLFVFPWAVAFF